MINGLNYQRYVVPARPHMWLYVSVGASIQVIGKYLATGFWFSFAVGPIRRRLPAAAGELQLDRVVDELPLAHARSHSGDEENAGKFLRKAKLWRLACRRRKGPCGGPSRTDRPSPFRTNEERAEVGAMPPLIARVRSDRRGVPAWSPSKALPMEWCRTSG